MWQWTVPISKNTNTSQQSWVKRPFVKEFKKDYDSVNMKLKNQENYALALEVN